MKQTKKVALVFFLVAAFAFVPPKHDIVGRWVVYAPNGFLAYIDFKPDGTYEESSAAGQLFHQGNYKFDNDLFSINDKQGCGETYWGTYKFNFVAEDSFHIALVEDSCTARRNEIMSGNRGLRRIKAN